tara:strand:+ start:246 stop:446 length:201 start_codon:yes stop_codon:yes gene_type:complete
LTAASATATAATGEDVHIAKATSVTFTGIAPSTAVPPPVTLTPKACTFGAQGAILTHDQAADDVDG